MKNDRCCARKSYRLQGRGFTLIELMITVAIIAILARIALPSYTAYVTRSKLAEAPNNLADLRVKMEQYYQDNRKYTDSAGTACGVSATVIANTSTYFTYTCTAAAQTYTWTATSNSNVGGTAGDYVYTINETATKATTKFKGSAQTGKACWLMKGTEC